MSLLLWSLLVLPAYAQGTDPVPVQVLPLSEVLISAERSAPADVRSLNVSTLSAEVSAVVRQVLADVGATVDKGTLLVQLDPTDYRLALQSAEANLAAAKAQKAQADARLKRAQELGANQYLSPDDLLARETEVAVLQAQIQLEETRVAIARRNVQKCRLEAPFSGVVDERSAQIGAYVTPGTALIVLTQSDRYELHAEIPDELAESLQAARSMRFRSRNESWPVQLLRLSPVIATERRSRSARFEFPSGAPPVGRSGDLLWSAGIGMLPANLVVRRNGVLGVFVNRAGKAEFTPLPDAQEGRPVQVDLPPDTEIVVQGRDRLQHGNRLAIDREPGV